MCNLFSPHSNLLLLHMILTCPKLGTSNNKSDSQQQQSIHSTTSDGYQTSAKDANNNNNNNGLRSPNQQQQLNSPTNKNSSAPKRSFDIMSLLQQQETPEYSRISSDDDVDDAGDGAGGGGDHEEEDSDEKIDVETLEEADCGTAGADSDLNRTFGLLKPALSLSEMAASPQQARHHYQSSFNNGSRGVKATNSVRGASKYPRGKAAAKNGARANSRIQNSKGGAAYQGHNGHNGGGSSRKMKAAEPESLELPHPSSAAQFAALQRSKGGGGGEGLATPGNLMPNLANLYSQFGPSLFANTFASFFHSPQSGPSQNGQHPPPPLSSLPSLPPTTNLAHNSSAAVSSLLGPALEQVFSSGNYPPQLSAGSLPPLPLPIPPPPPPSQSSSLFSPSSAHHFGSSMSGKIISHWDGSGHGGSSSLVTASNSPSSSTLSDSVSGGGGSPSSGSSSSSASLSPCISISPKSEYDQMPAGGTGGGKRGSGHLLFRQSAKPSHPYFLPPSSTASSPLISSMYLLSPSLTALSYQASNVCAYCGTAFRMTSDLVYHMRSHHKRMARGGGGGGGGDGADGSGGGKKRRNDALKCNICQETFRERHHLTRHMTSHQ
ncbi:Metal ion binding [Tyrophagus putrescentiae]|nr:Metal ion binding [Tyrophagus putrescentiae]